MSTLKIEHITNISRSGEDLSIDTNGNIGIGTTSPNRIFTINNGGPVVEIDPAGQSSNPIYFNYNRSTSAYLTPEYWALGHKFMYNGGSLALAIDSSGKVSIGGTTVTDSNVLNLQGDGSAVNVGAVFNKTNGTPQIWAWQVNNTTNDFRIHNYTASTNPLVLTTGGNIGVGTTSPATSYGRVLHIHDTGTSGANLRLTDATSGAGTGNGLDIIQLGVDSYFINREAGDVNFYTNGQERFTIHADGHLGFGDSIMNDSPWSNVFGARSQWDTMGTIAATDGSMQIGHNWYYDAGGSTGYKYIAGGKANRMIHVNDYVSWELTNSTGSAGGEITFVEQMKLNANGNLDIGHNITTSAVRINSNARSSTGLNVGGASTTATGIYVDNSSGGATLDIAVLGANYNAHGASAGDVWFYSPDNINIGGATGSTNEVRILGSGGIRHTFHNTGFNLNPTAQGAFNFNSAGQSQLSIKVSQYTAAAGTNIAQANVQVVNSAFGALVFVRGYNATGYPSAQFCDLVYFGYNASPTILAQQTVAGSPPNRTYTGSGYAMYLSYSSNVLNTKVNIIQSH